MPSPNGPSILRIRPIVSTVLCGSNAWHRGPKEIGPVVSVPSAVCYLLLPLLSASPSFLDQCGGWMWQAVSFVALGPSIGAGNTSRCFRSWKFPRVFPLPLAHHVRCDRITATVGMIGSPAMPGSDHPNCALLLLAFPHSSPATNPGGTGQPRSCF